MAELQQANGKYFRATLRQWILCFVVCNFNVDLGPEVEAVYPPDVSFSTPDLSTICFNGFPERQDADVLDDMYFSFTLRNNSPDINLSSPTPPYGSPGLFHGTCVFRQEQDNLSKRRFSQKSLVVVSNQEFPSFFTNILRVIATGGTIGDLARLEAACSQMEAWPAPRIGKQDLPFLGAIISLEIPPYPSFPLQGLSSTLSAHQGLLSGMSAYEPPEHWHAFLHHLTSLSTLYILYERALLGLPIIVLGHSPQQTSAITLAVVDLICPVPYFGVMRPYLPMQSTSLGGEIALLDPSQHTSQTSFILGITNPFLLQRIASKAPKNDASSSTPSTHPYILAINNSSIHIDTKGISSQNSKTTSNQISPTKTAKFFAMPRSSSTRKHRLSHATQSTSTAMTRIDVPGTPLHSQASPAHYLKSDKSFLSTLPRPSSSSSSSSSSATTANPATTMAIRRHFADLTARILAPINRFVVSSSSSADASALDQPFPVEEFVRSLAQENVAPVPFVGQTAPGRRRTRDEFYGRFCRSANFRAWMEGMAGAEKLRAVGLLDGPETG